MRWPASAGRGRPAAAARRPRQRLSGSRRSPGSTDTGATIRLAHRVERIDRDGAALAGRRRPPPTASSSPPAPSRRRAWSAPHDAAWAALAAALRYEPIVTVYARSAGCTLPEPLLALHADDARPAQFVFDRGRLGGDAGLLAFVISGAAPWVERGARGDRGGDAGAGAASSSARFLRAPLDVVRTIVEKRATFACTPGLERPPMDVAPGLFACGDYVDGSLSGDARRRGAQRRRRGARRARLIGREFAMKDPA